MRIGTEILIPAEMLVRTEPFPKPRAVVAAAPSAPAAAQVAGQPVSEVGNESEASVPPPVPETVTETWGGGVDQAQQPEVDSASSYAQSVSNDTAGTANSEMPTMDAPPADFPSDGPPADSGAPSKSVIGSFLGVLNEATEQGKKQNPQPAK